MLVFVLISWALSYLSPIALIWLAYLWTKPTLRRRAWKLTLVLACAAALGWQLQYMKAAHSDEIGWMFAAAAVTAAASVCAVALAIRAVVRMMGKSQAVPQRTGTSGPST